MLTFYCPVCDDFLFWTCTEHGSRLQLSGLSPLMMYQLDELLDCLDSDVEPLVYKAWENIKDDIKLYDNIETILISEFFREQARE